jgi:Zn-finger nucleic acid-binding protein
MNCPACQTELKMADRQGVEIDYCPQCRGVWLDRGELDKIIDRATADRSSSTAFEGRRRAYERDETRDMRWDDDDDERDLYKRRRRKSFLGELFDFG